MRIFCMKKFIIFIAISLLVSCGKNRDTTQDCLSAAMEECTISTQGYEELKLFITSTGHITVSIPVNGKPCLFMIDTGAGATVIDRSKQDRFGLREIRTSDYAAGIGSFSRLIGTTAMMNINGHEMKVDSLYLMDISFVNAELKKNRGRKVDGLLGADFLQKHHAIIDYERKKLYLKLH